MRILTTITLFVMLSVSYGQEGYEPDPRIINIYGKEKTKELVTYRPNLYNYYVYQLNHTCTIVDAQDAKNEKITKAKFVNSDNEKLSSAQLSEDYFNYNNWGIESDPEITKYYKLADGKILKVLSVRALTDKFRVSPKNTKSLY